MGGHDMLIVGGDEEVGGRPGRGYRGPTWPRSSPAASPAPAPVRTPLATVVERTSIGDDKGRAQDARPSAGGGDPAASATARQGAEEQRATVELVLRELRAHNFAVLSTVDEAGAPDAAGVNYGVSVPGRELALYVMTRRHLRKARNIARDPRVALVVPLPRRVFRFVPPATIQLRGRAEILDWTDAEGTAVFRRFWMGRRILAAYAKSRRRGETRVCFLRITLDPVIRTYAVGHSVWDLRRRMEAAAATVRLPAGHEASRAGIADATASSAP